MTLEASPTPIPRQRALVPPTRSASRQLAVIQALRAARWMQPLARGAGALAAGVVTQYGLKLATSALERGRATSTDVAPASPAAPEVVQVPAEAFAGLRRLVITDVTVTERGRAAR